MGAAGQSGFKVVAFDLDGTLADTAELSDGRRRPAMVLERCRAHELPTQLEFSSTVSRLASKVMRRGGIAAVVTRSPLPYAATLCYLLGIDFNHLLASGDGRSVEDRLSKLISATRIDPSELLYVGDRAADKAAAEAVGAAFMYPPWLAGDRDDTAGIEATVVRTGLLDGGRQLPGRPRRTLLAALRHAARAGASVPARTLDAFLGSDLDDGLRSALAWMLLRAAPAQVRRSELQELAFAGLPTTAYDCAIPNRLDRGMTGVSRALIRRSEYEHVSTKRERYFDLLRRLHPARLITTACMAVDHPDVPVYSFRPFNDQRGGELLRVAKDWGGQGKGHAGPEVVLSLLELPTLAIAARLALIPSSIEVVPVPASPWTASKPGQASQRIAIDAAVLSGRDYLDVLRKTHSGIECRERGNGRHVFVIDDQLTTGRSVSSAVTSLIGAGFRVRAVFTWSASRRHLKSAPSSTTTCWLTKAQWLLACKGGCGTQHVAVPSQDIAKVASYLDSVRI